MTWYFALDILLMAGNYHALTRVCSYCPVPILSPLKPPLNVLFTFHRTSIMLLKKFLLQDASCIHWSSGSCATWLTTGKATWNWLLGFGLLESTIYWAAFEFACSASHDLQVFFFFFFWGTYNTLMWLMFSPIHFSTLGNRSVLQLTNSSTV